jgi:hypothetical protein
VKDSFVITGTTNLPAGENVTIGIRNLLFQRGIRNLSPEWFREDVVTIVNGTGENNMFTTPIITPMEDIKDPKFYATYPDGEKMPVWLASEYMVRVEYSGNASVKSAVALFDIFPDNLSEQITPIPVMIIATPLHMPPPPTQTSLPGLLPLGSLGIIGCFVRLMRK